MSGQYSAPRYYEIAFDMNRRQEVNFLVHCFRHYARRPVHTELDIACGSGPHLIRLAERGYAMSGLDLSPENIAFLKERTRSKGFDANLIVEVFLHGCRKDFFGRRIHLNFLPDERRIRLQESALHFVEDRADWAGFFNRNIDSQQGIDRL